MDLHSDSSVLRDLNLYYHTATNMRPQQLLGVLERKVRQFVVPRVPIDFDARYEQKVPENLKQNWKPVQQNLNELRKSQSKRERSEARQLANSAKNGELNFIGAKIDFGTGTHINWEHSKLSDFPLLWRLKLQSLEFLEWAFLGYNSPDDAPPGLVSQFNNWILDWISKHQIGETRYLRRNWIPHSVSLRILNLCRYYSWATETLSEQQKQPIIQSIYKNSLFLSNHVEHDIGGNHLVENAVALVIAGVFFKNDEFLRLGVQTFSDSVDQFLADGGHFERSPMYHIQVTVRYLTAISLLQAEGYKVPSEILRVANRAVGFLEAMSTPDGEIPLFNDSVFDQMYSLETCLEYATNLGVGDQKSITNGGPPLSDSGYYWLGNGETRMLIDGGDVGPDHLPAHSHNDIGSYIFWVEGDRVITDTGTYQYTSDTRRQYSRSIRGHNTVQVDNIEPIPVGGQYLMGRRVQLTTNCINKDEVRGVQIGYRRKFFKPYSHLRSVFHADDWWFIWDKVKAKTDVAVTSRAHFHPDYSLSQKPSRLQISNDERSVWLKPFRTESSIETSEYFPQFGQVIQRDCLEMKTEGDTLGFGYALGVGEPPDIDLLSKGNTQKVSIAGSQFEF